MCALRRGRVPQSPPQPSEPRAPAVRARAAPHGPARRQAPGRQGPLLGAARSTGACTPSPPHALGLTQTTGRTLGPSPQSRCRRLGAKLPYNDASTAAILPRGSRCLLTLAPIRSPKENSDLLQGIWRRPLEGVASVLANSRQEELYIKVQPVVPANGPDQPKV